MIDHDQRRYVYSTIPRTLPAESTHWLLVLDILGHYVVLDRLVAMAKDKNRNRKAELLQGTLDMLILQTLRWGSQHGHGVGQAIRLRSGDLLDIEAGSLYPALHRLERQGLITARWDVSENNQRAKYYSLTVAGRKELIEEESKWDLLVKAISRVRRTT